MDEVLSEQERDQETQERGEAAYSITTTRQKTNKATDWVLNEAANRRGERRCDV
jgi:hypothetical protein